MPTPRLRPFYPRFHLKPTMGGPPFSYLLALQALFLHLRDKPGVSKGGGIFSPISLSLLHGGHLHGNATISDFSLPASQFLPCIQLMLSEFCLLLRGMNPSNDPVISAYESMVPAAEDGATYHRAWYTRWSCRPHVTLRGNDRRSTECTFYHLLPPSPSPLTLLLICANPGDHFLSCAQLYVLVTCLVWLPSCDGLQLSVSNAYLSIKPGGDCLSLLCASSPVPRSGGYPHDRFLLENSPWATFSEHLTCFHQAPC